MILGASGAGKSSFLRAGLWPRLLRDDSHWLPLRAIRASRGGAIEGNEGLLAALEEVHAALRCATSRAAAARAAGDAGAVHRAAAGAAASRGSPRASRSTALSASRPVSRPGRGAVCRRCRRRERKAAFARAAPRSTRDEALLLVTIRSDAYGLMQSAEALAGIEQVAAQPGPGAARRDRAHHPRAERGAYAARPARRRRCSIPRWWSSCRRRSRARPMRCRCSPSCCSG